MRDISEFSDSTSDYELFSFFYERIISKEVRTFSALKELAAPILGVKRCHALILRAFDLVKKLNWGFFSAINRESHSKLWNELVIPDKDFPDAGDIKRTLQISNLYIAMLDIHGYTRFCMESRKNLSMMHTLDRAIEYEISRICAACGVVCQRERGDEVVMVGASATDAIMATIAVIDFFNKTDVVKDIAIDTRRSAETEVLPEFKISAGITGGNTTSPLIMTEKGYLSGFLLNSGARLQMRANELSPSESRVMIAKQVQMNFFKENTQAKCTLVKNKAMFFFDTGQIEFKGVIIPTCEVVFNEKEWYKDKISEEMVQLIGAIRDNLWEQRIFTGLCELLVKTAKVMPYFSVTLPEPIEGMPVIANDILANLCKKAMNAYVRDEDYTSAVTMLQRITQIIEMIPAFDRLILDYLKGISARYTMLLQYYDEIIDQQVDAHASTIFQGNNYLAWEAAKKGAVMHKKLLDMGRTSKAIGKKKNLWYSLIKLNQSEMVFTLYSGKK